jgi:putative endonuclease
MHGFVYILQSDKNQTYYVGSTINLEARLIRHRRGFVKATKYLLPIELKFSKKYFDIKQARRTEYKLKKFKSRRIIERIIQEQNINMDD